MVRKIVETLLSLKGGVNIKVSSRRSLKKQQKIKVRQGTASHTPNARTRIMNCKTEMCNGESGETQ